MSKRRYAAGEPIDVSWTLGRANRFDWIGLYRRDADPARASYFAYRYTGAAVEGSVRFDASGYGDGPAPGTLHRLLLLTDVYREIASVDFVVTT